MDLQKANKNKFNWACPKISHSKLVITSHSVKLLHSFILLNYASIYIYSHNEEEKWAFVCCTYKLRNYTVPHSVFAPSFFVLLHRSLYFSYRDNSRTDKHDVLPPTKITSGPHPVLFKEKKHVLLR